MNYKHLRKDYVKSIFDFSKVNENPLEQFRIWLDDAVANQIDDANAMCLSTVNRKGQPSSRFVLLKELTSEGIIFFTNYNSRKAQEMESNPNIALNFYWKELERQVRIEGIVVKTDHEDSKQYFTSRPISSQISALSSPQSQIIQSKIVLEEKVKYYESHLDEVQCPEHWGGYLVIPHKMEFWQGRSNRLHDRLEYQLGKNKIWQRNILAP